ncbi:hypothetical protein [Nonomuraea sp. KM88]|uniref:hypothetical protein n=1 Tax=Nonomuraea sp. KM88 TaxID=3457427 RepID=UPI003FCE8142
MARLLRRWGEDLSGKPLGLSAVLRAFGPLDRPYEMGPGVLQMCGLDASLPVAGHL